MFSIDAIVIQVFLVSSAHRRRRHPISIPWRILQNLHLVLWVVANTRLESLIPTLWSKVMVAVNTVTKAAMVAGTGVRF